MWDTYARLLAREMEKELKVPAVVENNAAGAGVVGTAAGMSARADGYTLTMLMVGPITSQPFLSAVPYSLAQMELISMAISQGHLLVVPRDAPVKNLQEFHAWSRSKQLRTGINHVGGIPHLALLQLAKAGGIDYTIIPGYRSMADVALAMQGGHLDFGLFPPAVVEGAIREGRFRVIATLDDRRFPAYPDVPTLREQGLDINATVWGGIAVPKNTPASRVQILHDALKKALENEEVRRIVAQTGGQVMYMDAKAWRERIIREQQINRPLIEEMRARGAL
ncbi:MAG: tripartite tricarboxylate transporter substrate binding protein [Syntrophomonadaceae bacterium]|nr:tripartite tricarboxylate transporter substrate binding protein [Syntrophomonadaceae bacterium]